MLDCDYLVIGAGAASLAFIDSLLTECPSTKIVLVDKGEAPGGHWLHAYDFVRLHQPSFAYGLSSRQLEGSWLKLLLLKFTLPWRHRATKREILAYFSDFVRDHVASGAIQYFPNCQYRFDDDGQQQTPSMDNVHIFSSLDGKMEYSVKVNIKLVNGVLGECIIPSQHPVEFPVDDTINIMTPNQLYDAHQMGTILKETKSNKDSQYFIVLGNGKTAMDTIVYLQRNKNIDLDKIFWVIPNDVWMIAMEGPGIPSPWSWPNALMDHNCDFDTAALALEKNGILVRLDKSILPSKFRFPVVVADELLLMRRIKDTIRHGRVTGIHVDGTPGEILVSFTKGDTWKLGGGIPVNAYNFIHCTSPGPFNGRKVDGLFPSDNQLNLFFLFVPPVSLSMSVLGYLEACRLKGSLDLSFGRQLVNTIKNVSKIEVEELSDNQVLNHLICGCMVLFESANLKQGAFRSTVTLAMFLALASKDPLESYKWLSKNRLSLLSVPGYKCGICQSLDILIAEGHTFGYNKSEIQMLCLLNKKLQPLCNK